MEQLVDKFGLYCQQIQYAIPEIKNSKDRTTLRGKFEKLIDDKVLLHSGFFSDILPAAKAFSLTTQKSDIDIIAIVENVEWTKRSYERLLKKFKGNPEAMFTDLPTLSAIITEIEGSEHGERIYQDQKLKFYTQEKLYLKNHDAELIESILSCYVQRYSNVYSERNDEDSVSAGDNILFQVCRVLNSAVWPDLTNNSDEDEIKLSLQLDTIRINQCQYSNQLP